MKCRAAFGADWKAAGHAQIKVASDADAFNTLLGQGCEDIFALPVVVSQFPTMQKDFSDVFTTWEGYFTKHCAKHNLTKAVCDFEKKHGVDAFKTALQTFLPEKHMMRELLPSTKELCEKVVMFGFTKTHNSCQWESQHLGSVIHHFKGKGTYLLMAPEDFRLEHFKALNPGCDNVKASSVKSFVDGMCTDFKAEHPKMFKDTSQTHVVCERARRNNMLKET